MAVLPELDALYTYPSLRRKRVRLSNVRYLYIPPSPSLESFSSIRESGQLYLEKCAQTLKESGAIFTLLGRLTFGEMSVFDDALGLHFSFCQ